jgi:hypothetical protein
MTESVEVASGSLPGCDDVFSVARENRRKPLKNRVFVIATQFQRGWVVEPAIDVLRKAMSALRSPFCAMSRQAFRAGRIASRRTRRVGAVKKARLLRDAQGRVPRAACVRRTAERIAGAFGRKARLQGPRRPARADRAAGRQARRRSRTFEGDSPNRAVNSLENVDSRGNPHPVAMAATEASASAESRR